MNNILIEVKNAEKTINGHKILKDINAEFDKGKFHVIIGRNGAGKTMLLRIIAGLTPSTAGSVYFQGKQIGKDIDFPPKMTCFINSPGFLANESGFNNLKYIYSLSNKPNKKRILEVLEEVGLKDHRNKKVCKYSSGMKQRLGLAQVLLEDSDIIIFDEPMSGLDIDGRERFKKILLDIKTQGKTMLIATHMLEDVEELSDSISKIEDGMLYRNK